MQRELCEHLVDSRRVEIVRTCETNEVAVHHARRRLRVEARVAAVLGHLHRRHTADQRRHNGEEEGVEQSGANCCRTSARRPARRRRSRFPGGRRST